ncbi:hypothetical protein N657DRAFT_651771 [Parathielavia appendiculata]|uniref:Uncharacterized protein n=1 Tax=Parathielavia appendiculata TaxID=2587402 RepID=A0AAN6TNX1_9PEZI|nr:hypothetical protein N657DRAFT_651771 [Parathielavia appendiculata]
MHAAPNGYTANEVLILMNAIFARKTDLHNEPPSHSPEQHDFFLASEHPSEYGESFAFQTSSTQAESIQDDQNRYSARTIALRVSNHLGFASAWETTIIPWLPTSSTGTAPTTMPWTCTTFPSCRARPCRE